MAFGIDQRNQPISFFADRYKFQTELSRLLKAAPSNSTADVARSALSPEQVYTRLTDGRDKGLFVTKYDIGRAKNLVEKYQLLQAFPEAARLLESLETYAKDNCSKDLMVKIKEYQKQVEAVVKVDKQNPATTTPANSPLVATRSPATLSRTATRSPADTAQEAPTQPRLSAFMKQTAWKIGGALFVAGCGYWLSRGSAVQSAGNGLSAGTGVTPLSNPFGLPPLPDMCLLGSAPVKFDLPVCFANDTSRLNLREMSGAHSLGEVEGALQLPSYVPEDVAASRAALFNDTWWTKRSVAVTASNTSSLGSTKSGMINLPKNFQVKELQGTSGTQMAHPVSHPLAEVTENGSGQSNATNTTPFFSDKNVTALDAANPIAPSTDDTPAEASDKPSPPQEPAEFAPGMLEAFLEYMAAVPSEVRKAFANSTSQEQFVTKWGAWLTAANVILGMLKSSHAADSVGQRFLRSVPAGGMILGTLCGSYVNLAEHNTLAWKLSRGELKKLPWNWLSADPFNWAMDEGLKNGGLAVAPGLISLGLLYLYTRPKSRNTFWQEWRASGWPSATVWGGAKIVGTWFASGFKGTRLANDVVADRFRNGVDWSSIYQSTTSALTGVRSTFGQAAFPSPGDVVGAGAPQEAVKSFAWGDLGLGMGKDFKPSGHLMMHTAVNVAWLRTLNYLQKMNYPKTLAVAVATTCVANGVFTYYTTSKGYHSVAEVAAGAGVGAAVNLAFEHGGKLPQLVGGSFRLLKGAAGAVKSLTGVVGGVIKRLRGGATPSPSAASTSSSTSSGFASLVGVPSAASTSSSTSSGFASLVGVSSGGGVPVWTKTKIPSGTGAGAGAAAGAGGVVPVWIKIPSGVGAVAGAPAPVAGGVAGVPVGGPTFSGAKPNRRRSQ